MVTSNSTDFFHQSMFFDSPHGSIEVPLPDIDDFNLYNIEICINYGAQLGASIAVLLVLLLLTKPDKHLSVIMVLNALSLIFNIIRNVLQCMYFTGPFAEVYARFTMDFTRVHGRHMAMSVTATVFTLLLQICVEISLCLQVRVVCVTLSEFYRHIIYTISAIVALLAIAFRFAYVVENDKLIVAQVGSASILWLGSATNITTCISIFWFCAVFVTKLGHALYQRKKMGLGQFGPMQILFIMGCQTLVIPAVLSIVQYWAPPAMSSNALTACALFLPLSSLWASASLDNRSQGSNERKIIATYPSGFSNPSTLRNPSTGPLSPTTAATLRVNELGFGGASPRGMEEHHVFVDLEKQGLAGR